MSVSRSSRSVLSTTRYLTSVENSVAESSRLAQDTRIDSAPRNAAVEDAGSGSSRSDGVATRWLPRFDVKEFWFDPPFIVVNPKLHPDDSRFAAPVQRCRIYCDGFCARSFRFDGVGFDGAYCYLPEQINDCSTWSQAVRTLEKLYLSRYWKAAWLCASCWQKMYWQQDGELLHLSEVRRRLSFAHVEFQRIMRLQL